MHPNYILRHDLFVDVVNDTSEDMKDTVEKIKKMMGDARNYGPTPEELEETKRQQDQEKQKKEAEEKAEKERQEAEEASGRKRRHDEWVCGSRAFFK